MDATKPETAAILSTEPKPAAKAKKAKAAKPVGTPLLAKAAKPAARPASKPASARKAAAAVEQPVKPPKPRTARQLAAEAIENGQVPLPPDFSAKTHARFLGKHAELVALVERGDIKRLRAWTINPVSSSPKALLRYRDQSIAALTAGAKATKG